MQYKTVPTNAYYQISTFSATSERIFDDNLEIERYPCSMAAAVQTTDDYKK